MRGGLREIDRNFTCDCECPCGIGVDREGELCPECILANHCGDLEEEEQ